MKPPSVSVIMGVFNGQDTVEKAIYSILEQTFTDFEFIIVDDGSTDGTTELITQIKDERIQFFTQKNQGLTKTLNRAIKTAKGRFIARMDADDIADIRRFELQVSFLDRHPDVVLLGTAFEQIYTSLERSLVVYPPCHDQELRHALCEGNPMCHSSVMMSAPLLKKIGGYDETFRYLQDYELWSRMALHGRLANLPEVLIKRYFLDSGLSNDWKTEWVRWVLFRKANHLAIERLNGPSLAKVRTYITLTVFALSRIRRSWFKFSYRKSEMG